MSDLRFDLHISPSGHVIASSSFGEVVSDILTEVPLSVELLTHLVKTGKTNEGVMIRLGKELYDWLFPSAIDEFFMINLSNAVNGKIKLHLRFRIEADGIAALPLELLYYEKDSQFLAIHPVVLLSRYLLHNLPEGNVRKRDGMLNMLVIISNPVDQEFEVDPEKWEITISEALIEPVNKKLLRLAFVKHATYNNINKALLAHKPDIVQFIGHGEYKNNKGYVILVNEEDDESLPCDDRTFSDMLLGYCDNLGLICLAACEGAKSDSPQGFKGIAPKLVQRGIPAVIAMQYIVDMKAFEAFINCFFMEVSMGKPVDLSVQSARSAIGNIFGYANSEFISPVLYMRSDNGILFNNNA
jgi:hypothetical protein